MCSLIEAQNWAKKRKRERKTKYSRRYRKKLRGILHNVCNGRSTMEWASPANGSTFWACGMVREIFVLHALLSYTYRFPFGVPCLLARSRFCGCGFAIAAISASLYRRAALLFFFCCVVKDIVELWILQPKIWFWSQCGQGCDR